MTYERSDESPEGRPSRRPGIVAVAALVGALLGAVAGGGAGYFAGSRAGETRATRPAPTAAPAVVNQVRVEQSSALTDAVQKAMPSVVALQIEGPARRDSQGRLLQPTSVGSGIIIDARGYIVTNAHVVAGAQLINVALHDGRTLPGVVLAEDAPFTDLAVLKIQEGGLTPAELGDSNAVKPGDLVAAIGTPVATTDLPLAFVNSVTAGVVSGVHRRWLREGVVQEDLIQTDSALNHGNSGGALINLQGQIIGITSTVVRQAETGETIEGLGFAIASNTVREITDPVVATGKLERPEIGVITIELTQELVTTNNLPVSSGAYVQEVLPESPGSEAGIRPGDIIVRLGDTPISTEAPFINLLKRHRPRDRVTVVVNRGGREIALDVVLAAR